MPRIDDLRYRNQWALVKIKERDSPKSNPHGGITVPPDKTPVTVAIVDWGIKRDHRDFGPGLSIDGYRVIPPVFSSNFSDDSVVGHGTMLAGIIAGVAPDVSLLAITNPSVKYVPSFSPDPAVPLGGIRLLCYLFAARVSNQDRRKGGQLWALCHVSVG